MELIDRADIEKILSNLWKQDDGHDSEHRIYYNKALQEVQCEIDTLEVIDPYEECVQHASIKAGIQAHAETYSFNIESELFNQLSKEQQGLWRKEIEQACISGGEVGVELAKDPRYKENVKVKEVNLDELLSNLDKDIKEFVTTEEFEKDSAMYGHYWAIAKHSFELGLKAKGK